MIEHVKDITQEKFLNHQIENETIKQLLVLEKEFRDHRTLMKDEIKFQKDLLARIWTLSQRYNLLDGTETCNLPEIYTTPAEDVILQEFMDKIKQIKHSNFSIRKSLNGIRKSCAAFDMLCTQLNIDIESPLIIGDAHHKPLSYFIELTSDVFKYFHSWILKLTFSSHHFHPNIIESIDNYKNLLEISADFEEYLTLGLTYCKPLRTKIKC